MKKLEQIRKESKEIKDKIDFYRDLDNYPR